MDGHQGHHEHNGHDGHEGHDMPAMCSMNASIFTPMLAHLDRFVNTALSLQMLFNWQIQDVCVVYEWWHIHSALEMFISCLVIFGIAAAYEYLRAQSSHLDQRWYEANAKRQADATLGENSDGEEDQGLLRRNTAVSRYHEHSTMVGVCTNLL